jgi:hypothetical protein
MHICYYQVVVQFRSVSTVRGDMEDLSSGFNMLRDSVS